jgi:hypothetical protein
MTPEMTTLIGTLAGTAIGAIIGFLGTWLTLRYQYRMKATELLSQSQLKAKELLFSAYQQRIERINNKSRDMGESVGKLITLYQASTDQEERRQLNIAFFMIIKESYELYKEWFRELEEERNKVGLGNSSPAQVTAVREALAVDFQNITSEADVQRIFINWAKLVAAMDGLWQDVLAKKSEDLFSQDVNRQSLVKVS